MVNYIQNELEALEREQKQIDKQAALLEKDLRRVMESGTESLQEGGSNIVFM
jgi:predicted  nucleic acid-binding Zn-ribbon protein